MKRIILYFSGILLLVALGIGAFYYGYYVKTPKYAVQEALDAARASDLTGFEQRVDLQHVVEHGFDNLFAEKANKGESITTSIIYAMRPVFVQTITQSIREHISPASVLPENPLSTEEKITPLHESNYEVRSIGTGEVNDNEAEIILHIRDRETDTYLDVKLGMWRDSTGYWRVRQINNINEVYETMRRTSGNVFWPQAPEQIPVAA